MAVEAVPMDVSTNRRRWWYVARSGDDATGDGTKATPFATGAKAASAARDGDTLILSGVPQQADRFLAAPGVTVLSEY